MKRIIFTSYDDLSVNNISKQDFVSKNQIADYFDRLVENKKSYADSIGVDFKLYHNTMQDFTVSGELEFTSTSNVIRVYRGATELVNTATMPATDTDAYGVTGLSKDKCRVSISSISPAGPPAGQSTATANGACTAGW
jgi:hypothetical protein